MPAVSDERGRADAGVSPVSEAASTASVHYRRALLRSVLAFDDELERLESDDSAQPTGDTRNRDKASREMLVASEYLKVSRMLWHLTEVVFLRDSGVCTPALVDWLREHFHDPVEDVQVRDLLLSLSTPTPSSTPTDPTLAAPTPSHEPVWSAINRAIVQGQLTAATALIEGLMDATRGSPLATADPHLSILLHQLQTFPTDRAHSDAAETIFVSEWREWHSATVTALESIPRGSRGTRSAELLALLSGTVSVLDTLENGVWNTWYHRLNVKLFFDTYGVSARLGDLFRLVSSCLQESSEDATQALYEAILATLNRNEAAPVKIMVDCDMLGVATHLADLLWRCGYLRASEPLATWNAPYKDHLLLEHASQIAGQPGMWRVAVNYAMSAAVPSGRALAIEILGRVPPTTDAVTHKLLSTATRFGLTDLCRSIARVRGLECARRYQQYGSALIWLAKSKDPAALRFVAGKLLELLCGSAPTAHADTTDALAEVGMALKSVDDPDLFLVCPRLRFVTLYHEYLCLLRDVDQELSRELSPTKDPTATSDSDSVLTKLRTAATRVFELINSGYAPKHFWSRLLLGADEAGLLTFEPALLSVTQMQELIVAFEDVAQVHHRGVEYLASTSPADIDRIRSSLASGLATAIVDEFPTAATV